MACSEAKRRKWTVAEEVDRQFVKSIAIRRADCRVCWLIETSANSNVFRRVEPKKPYWMGARDTVVDGQRTTDSISGARVTAMQVSVSARHGSLQNGDHELVEQKVEKLRRLYDRISAISVTIDLEPIDNPTVEICVSVEHADDCVAKAHASTVIAALDLAIPKMEQQLRRLKEKKTGHRATGHKHIDSPTVADED